MLYKIENDKLIPLNEQPFKLERDLEQIIDKHLQELTGLQLIEGQCMIEDYRFDALAYNNETKAFVIIEYKKVRCDHLVDQGFAYLGTMLKRKAEFVLKYNNKNNINKSINDFDWSQSRVMFISPAFSNYQLDANDYINMPFDLYIVKKYNNLLSFEKIENKRNNKIDLESSGIVSKENNIMNEIKVYTEEDHFKYGNENARFLYETIKSRMQEWGEFSIEPKKIYIAFKGKTNIVDITFHKTYITICINLRKGELNDPNNFMDDCSTIGHNGNGSYKCDISNDENIDYIMSLIKQSWNKNK